MKIKGLQNAKMKGLHAAFVSLLLVLAHSTPAQASEGQVFETDREYVEYGSTQVNGTEFSVDLVVRFKNAQGRVRGSSYTLKGDCARGFARQTEKQMLLSTGKTQSVTNPLNRRARGVDAIMMGRLCLNQPKSQNASVKPVSIDQSITEEDLRKNARFRDWGIEWRDRGKYDQLTSQEQTALRKQREAAIEAEKKADSERVSQANTQGLTGKGYKIEEVHKMLQRQKGEPYEVWYLRIDPIIVNGKHMTPQDYRNWRKTLSQEDNRAYDRITKEINSQRMEQFDKEMVPIIIEDVLKN
jgi:hypothetical protein